jgi:hypothetical protein
MSTRLDNYEVLSFMSQFLIGKIMKKRGVDLAGLGQGQLVDSCEHGSLKDEGFLG